MSQLIDVFSFDVVDERAARERTSGLAAASVEIKFAFLLSRRPRFRRLSTRLRQLTVRMGVLALRVEDMVACLEKRMRGGGG